MLTPHHRLDLPVEFTPWISRSDSRFDPNNTTTSQEIVIGRSEYSANNRPLLLWLLEQDLIVDAVRVFRSLPHAVYHLHRDLDPSMPQDYPVVKLNFIRHSFGSRMLWYKLKPGAVSSDYTNPSGITSQHYRPEDCDLAWDTECDTDCLINGGEIHTLVNGPNQDQPRMAYSWVITNREGTLTYADAVAQLLPWLS